MSAQETETVAAELASLLQENERLREEAQRRTEETAEAIKDATAAEKSRDTLLAALREARRYCMGTDASSENVMRKFDALLAEHKGGS